MPHELYISSITRFFPYCHSFPRTLLTFLLRGHPGEEAEDAGFTFVQGRRRSNSSTHSAGLASFKTKFETVETDPVFEEEFHGASAEDYVDGGMLQKEDTADSLSGASVEEEEGAKKA